MLGLLASGAVGEWVGKYEHCMKGDMGRGWMIDKDIWR